MYTSTTCHVTLLLLLLLLFLLLLLGVAEISPDMPAVLVTYFADCSLPQAGGP